jgi:hypothetical protein
MEVQKSVFKLLSFNGNCCIMHTMIKKMMSDGIRLIVAGATVLSATGCAPAPTISCLDMDRTFRPTDKPNYNVLNDPQLLQSIMQKIETGDCHPLANGQTVLISSNSSFFIVGAKTDGQKYIIRFNPALVWGMDGTSKPGVEFEQNNMNKGPDGQYTSGGYTTAYINEASDLYSDFTTDSSVQTLTVRGNSQPVASSDYGFRVKLVDVDDDLGIEFMSTSNDIQIVSLDGE